MQSESGTHKISDSGYSNSCSNSQSQRSGTSGTSGSSKSRNSGSNSSRSSGYCGGSRHQCVSTNSSNEVNPKPLLKRNIEKDHKKKKLKVDGITTIPALTEIETATDDIPNCTTVDDKTLNEKEDETTDNGQENVEPNHPTVIEGAEDIQVSLKSPQLSTLLVESTETEPKAAQTWATSSAGMLPPEEQGISKNAEIEKEENASLSTPHAPEQSTPKKRVTDSEDGFYFVISMHDGVVLYTTPSLTTILGFPQDMWLGRSFIDFVHPKDRVTFASHITTDVAIPIAETTGQIKECRQNSLYVSLRKYRGLKSCGFGVVENAVTYMPFHLSLIFRQMQPKSSSLMSTNSNTNENGKSLYLIVSASPMSSPYKVPDETYVSTRFCTRHTTTCEISHVDPDVVTNFGFFPQDMLRHSIFEFYHPEDMLFLKKVYQTVVENAQIAGSIFRSKPYRFATQNGTYATIETDWNCFVNPWTRKVEFIVGHHRVLQGPRNPNIFESSREDSSQISEEVLKESKLIQAEIQYLLLSELPRPGNIAKQQVSQRCKDLASFMETLMEDVTRSNIQVDVPHEVDPSFSEKDSVMLGEISPHHDYYDSKSSSETPPSYNQLNYNENLQRFFESKPMTKAEDDNIEPKPTTSILHMEVESKNNANSPTCLNRKHLSPIQTSGDSGSGSADNSSGSNPNMDGSGNTSGTNASISGSYKPPTLTEELLVRHNEDMEKEMAKRHKERRSGNKADREAHKYSKNYHKMCFQSPMDKNDPQGHGHGVKRSGSHSWEGDYHKLSKHQHKNQVYNPEAASIIPSVLNPTMLRSNVNNSTAMPNETFLQSPINNANLWPPFSVSASPMQGSNQCITTSAFTGSVMPVYYIVQAGQPPQEHPGPPFYSFSCLPNMVYPPVAIPTPMMYPSLALLQPLSLPNVKTTTSLIPSVPNVPTTSKTSMSVTTHTHENRTVCTTNNENNKTYKPASQATSIKAEPGSGMGSVASNSVTNRALSEYSKRDLGVHSLCSIGSPHATSPEQDTLEKTNTSLPLQLEEREKVDTKGVQSGGSLQYDGESSYSSFYSSFLKTEESISNDDNTNSDNKGNSTSKSKEWKNKKPQGIKRKTIPPWLEAVTVTPELVYQYQLSLKNTSDILKADLLSLKEIKQPMLVNDQLSQLYLDLELEGLSSKLTLEDGLTSSSSSGEETISGKKKASRKRRSYSKMVIIYEEDAPFPPPPPPQ